ncbi:MAG: magnesium-translocating P-type ATPase [Patescibacteria group bacterium]|nr:magnesium-translocating P-type ATPase [Patescibacteria group bacterium]
MDFSAYTGLNRETLFEKLSTGGRGLDKKVVAIRQKQFGLNEVGQRATAWSTILARQFRSSFVYLLFGAALVAFILGESIDGSMILLFIVINAGLGFYQEYHSEKTVRLLQKYSVPSTRVRRENAEELVPTSKIVPGDFVIFEAGDIIPADVRFISENDLMVNESIITGESVPVKKIATANSEKVTEIYQANNLGFSGTSIVCGRCEAIVIATGRQTVLGGIAHLTSETKRVSAFAKGLGKFSTFILRLVLVTLIFLFIANSFIKGGRSSLIELAIFSVALAVSVIPEALPMVTTFSLSRGALRLAKNKVVVKRLSAIEDLGSIEVLCTDKTGTLTENKLTVAEIKSGQPNQTVFLAGLASSDTSQKSDRQPNNAFDLAVWEKLSVADHAKFKEYKLINEIPFDPERRRNSLLVEHQGERLLIVRGAPETVIEACPGITESEKIPLFQWLGQQGRLGYRTIAVATKKFDQPEDYQPIEEEKGLKLVGLISFVDPIKDSTLAAVRKSRKLGVQIKILTGDSPEVAGAVAHKIGLLNDPDNVITGQEFEAAKSSEQLSLVRDNSVFARVSPQQKYHIIQLLQQQKEVGFLGEGINDAPALKISNVGLVVQGAADIAREAADIILLKHSLEVIVDGIREGREVFSNTIKYLKITLASNFGNFYAIAIATLLIDFLPMLPLQILLLNLLSDFPMIAIASDATDPDELKRPKIYDVKEVALVATILGIVSSIFDFIIFATFLRTGPETLHTYWFIGSILTELALIYSLRTRLPFFRAKRPSATLLWLTVTAAAITIVLPFLAWSRHIFKLIQPSFSRLLLIFGIVIVYFIVSEIVKLFYYRFHSSPKTIT